MHSGKFNVCTRDVREGIHVLNELPVNVSTFDINYLKELSVNGLNELSINVRPCDVLGLNKIPVDGMN